ncbi:MAG: hypothetical protein JXA36_05450, partial [Coriobacteriia bacterium]|nr:hypothetical protein [Coriobacteriia bacterium]
MVAAVRRARGWWANHPVPGWGIIVVGAVALVAGAFVLPAMGDTTDVVPTSIVTDTAKWYASSGNKVTDVATKDGSNYIYVADRTAVDEIVFGIGDISDIGTINSVTMYVTALDLGKRGLTATGYVSGSSAGALTPTLTRSFADYSLVLTAPGGSWDYTEVNNLTVGLKPAIAKNETTQMRVDAVWFVVNYTPPTPTTVVIGDGTDPAAAYVNLGQTGVSTDAFTLQRTAGSGAATVSKITVTNSGTTPSTTVAGVDVYRDDGDGSYDGGDTKLNTSAATFSGTTATVTLTSAESVDGTLRTYFVVYAFSGSAADAATANANVSIVSGDYANIDTLTDNDDAGNDFTVQYTVVVMADGVKPVGVHLPPGQPSYAVDSFTLQRTQGSKSSTVSKITVTNSGTTPSLTISNVDIHRDTNGNGTFQLGVDAKINTVSGTFSSPAEVTLTNPESVDGTADTYFVVYTFSAEAVDGATANSEVGVAESDYSNIDTFTDTTTISGTFEVDGDLDPPTDPSPHAIAGADTDFCNSCHAPHQAIVDTKLLLDLDGLGEVQTEVEFCFICHDAAPANVKTGASNASFGGTSGHELESVGESGDLTDTCSSCHNPHKDSSTDFRIPLSTVNLDPVTGADNSWCLACHDDADSWYASITTDFYPALDDPLKTASGYPETGTYPGETVYTSASDNAHILIPSGSMTDWVIASREATRVAGDCLWCHSGHQGISEYDGLVATYNASTSTADDTVDGDYAAACFRCHETGGLVGSVAVDIATKALVPSLDPDAHNGHRVRTAGGYLTVNSPLPCYECHNPHGSSTNSRLISDVLGTNLNPSTSIADMRKFCLTCHTTNDTDPLNGSRPYGWDSSTSSYKGVAADATVVGLSRSAAVAANRLRLSNQNGHEMGDTTEDCLNCHGDVHLPTEGVSAGGEVCIDCHFSALGSMVEGASGSLDTYHHVLDHATPYLAPVTTADYPTTMDLACVSCHVDH